MDPAEGLLADPYAVYDRLRDTAPVHRIAGTDGKPAWLVTRYDDVREGLANPLLSLDKKHALPGNYRGLALPPALDANLLNMDAPDHTRIRRLVGRAFTLRRVEQLREPVRETAHRLLDALGTHGSTDLIASYAAPLPITVICDLLGVPDEHRRDFRAWTDPLVTPDPARPDVARESVVSLLGFFTGLLADKRKNPADDLLSDLIAVQEEGDRLTEDELMSLAFLILFAGYENTVHLIGNAVLALLRHPEQLAALREDPARLPDAVGEFARYEGPALLAIRRFPVRDVTIGGVTVPAGRPCCCRCPPPTVTRAGSPTRPPRSRPRRRRPPRARPRRPLLPGRAAGPAGDGGRPRRAPRTVPGPRPRGNRTAPTALAARPRPARASGDVLTPWLRGSVAPWLRGSVAP